MVCAIGMSEEDYKFLMKFKQDFGIASNVKTMQQAVAFLRKQEFAFTEFLKGQVSNNG